MVTYTLILYIVLPLITIFLGLFIFKKKVGSKILFMLLSAILWLSVFSAILSNASTTIYETIKITALETHNLQSRGNDITVTGLRIGNQDFSLRTPIEGKWLTLDSPDNPENKHFKYSLTDANTISDITKSITIEIPVGTNREVLFSLSDTGGEAEVFFDDSVQIIDTYGVNSEEVLEISDSNKEMLLKKQQKALLPYSLIFGITSVAIFAVMFILTKPKYKELYRQYKFLFGELVKRDFILKYKRTILGILWSILSPLLNLLIMWIVFGKMLGSNINHYAVYLFVGQILFAFFSETTNQGMTALLDNAGIYTKVNVAKYMFLLSKNVSSLINFMINILILFMFILFDNVPITANYIMLIFPLFMMMIFNFGMGLILSSMYIFFRDMQYLWGILCQLIMWLSAIFYPIDHFPAFGKNLFFLNPLYLFIRYTRKIIIDNTVPSLWFHMLMIGYALAALIMGAWMYKKYNHEFLYYV